MNLDWELLIKNVDELIKQGQVNEARRVLWAVSPKDIPRKYIVPVARLTRRTRMNYFTLRVLKPVIKTDHLFSGYSTEEELALFAGALVRVGARNQGIKILSELEAHRNPDVLMFQVDAYFSEWNYKAAIPLLKKYLEFEQLSDYQILVGKLNLAASLVFEGLNGQAQDLLAVLRAEFKSKNYRLLYANSLELSAQVSLAQKKFSLASNQLELASKILKNESSSYGFFLMKWKTISDLIQFPNNKNVIEKIRLLKEESKKINDWESLRQIDFFNSISAQNEKLFLHLMIGTPYVNYRSILRKKYGSEVELPKSYQFQITDKERLPLSDEIAFTINKAHSLNIRDGKTDKCSLSYGQLPHRLLMLLTKDFYRPLSVGEAFSLLYANEYFDPISSPERIRNLVSRINVWFKKSKIPLFVQSEFQMLHLVSKSQMILEVATENTVLNKNNLLLAKLYQQVQKNWFTSSALAIALNISQRSSQRLIHANSNLFETQGTGQNQRYRYK